MRVKRYLVNTLPEAVQLIRNDLGKDAVILESKEIKVGGVLGMFRKKKIEVLAAVEPNKKQEDKKKLDKSEVDLVLEQILKASQRTKTEQPVVPPKPLVQEPQSNLFSQVYNSNKYAPQAKEDLTEPELNVGLTNHIELPQKVQANHDERNKAVNDLVDESAAQKEMSKTELFILNELKHLRQEMKAINQQKEERKDESINISYLRTHLFDQELNSDWINTLCEIIQEYEQNEQRELQPDEIWNIAKTQLLDWLLPFSKATIEKTTKVIQLVGPTGVGKTTTIAKLAANFTIQNNVKVGFISADTFRIAAVDQLKTYANILNLPLEVVFSPADLPRAYKQLEACDLIIMDTAGRNYKSDLFVSEVNSLIANTQFSEGILVVSLTSRTRDMALVAEKFSKYGVRKVVFTKLDEAHAYGSIFNMIMQYGLQPIYMTSGQNVPDDIEPFTIEKYVSLLLGDPKYE